MLKILLPVLEGNRILPDHQFGFRQKNFTIIQVHRSTEIYEELQKKETVMLCGVPRYHKSM
jgi:hypothetical protein